MRYGKYGSKWNTLYTVHYFGSILYHCIYGCIFRMFLFNFVNYVLLLLCMFCSGYSVSLCCSVYSSCVTVYCTTATGCRPNCRKQIYQIISYQIVSCFSGCFPTSFQKCVHTHQLHPIIQQNFLCYIHPRLFGLLTYPTSISTFSIDQAICVRQPKGNVRH